MNRLEHKQLRQKMRQHRVRSRVNGTAKRPRLSVFVSLKHVSAQLIDDEKGHTVASATTANRKVSANMSEKAASVGAEIAKKAKAAKVKAVVFDRGGKLYHGRVKALAEAARKEGLKF